MNSKPKVFLSYAREDRDTVSKIYNYLLNNSCEPWMDIEKLLPGQDWEYEIDIAIKNTDFFIACLTTNSVVKTGYVQKELRKALDIIGRFPEGKIFVIPLRLDDCGVPHSLEKYNYTDWFDLTSRKLLLKAIHKV